MNPPTCPLPGHPSRVPVPWAESETHHHQSTGEGLQATLQAEWILPIEVGDSTWDAGGEHFGIVQDYYQMIRGGTKGRESERSGWFVEELEWENRDKSGQMPLIRLLVNTLVWPCPIPDHLSLFCIII